MPFSPGFRFQHPNGTEDIFICTPLDTTYRAH